MIEHEVREPIEVIWRQWAGLAALFSGVAAWRGHRWLRNEEWELIAMCLLLVALYIINQVRERVVVNSNEVVLVRTFWTRRVSRSRVQAVRRSLPGWRARLVLHGGSFGMDLPFSSDQAIDRLAHMLSVPITDQGAE